jgi:hypothetical protein
VREAVVWKAQVFSAHDIKRDPAAIVSCKCIRLVEVPSLVNHRRSEVDARDVWWHLAGVMLEENFLSDDAWAARIVQDVRVVIKGW